MDPLRNWKKPVESKFYEYFGLNEIYPIECKNEVKPTFLNDIKIFIISVIRNGRT